MKTHKILYIDSDETYHYIVKHTLKDNAIEVCLPRMNDAMPKIENNGYDFVLLDYLLKGGDHDVFDFIREIRKKIKSPIYILSNAEEFKVVEGLEKEGIKDVGYISKADIFERLTTLFQ